MEDSKTIKKSSLATAGMVLGIIAIVFSVIPLLNIICFIPAILATIFGIIALCKKSSIGKSVTAANLVPAKMLIVIIYVPAAVGCVLLPF